MRPPCRSQLWAVAPSEVVQSHPTVRWTLEKMLEMVAKCPALIGELREESGLHRKVLGLGIEQPCWRLTQRAACGPHVFLSVQWRVVLGIHCIRRSAG